MAWGKAVSQESNKSVLHLSIFKFCSVFGIGNSVILMEISTPDPDPSDYTNGGYLCLELESLKIIKWDNYQDNTPLSPWW